MNHARDDDLNLAMFEGFERGADAVCVVLEDSLQKHEIVEQRIILEDVRVALYEEIKGLMERFNIKAVGDDEEFDPSVN